MTASNGWPIRTSYAEIKPASWFLGHPLNFRLPNAEHSNFLDASLDELGWVKPVIVNRRTAPEWGPEQGVETLLDGHERIRKALQAGDDTPVPLDWVDLPPHLEPIALAILDEMVTYRQKDREKLAMLIDDAKPANAALQQMLSKMAAKEGIIPLDDPSAEWQGMPEFVHEDQTAFQVIIVHFRDQHSVKEFAKFVQRQITPQTKSLWFPDDGLASIGQTHFADDP